MRRYADIFAAFAGVYGDHLAFTARHPLLGTQEGEGGTDNLVRYMSAGARGKHREGQVVFALGCWAISKLRQQRA